MKKIGIMGGTFDPIHYGHLVTAEAARVEYDLDKVIFVPSNEPPHKEGRKVESSSHRLDMVKFAIASNKDFEVSDIEIKRGGWSYTVDTMKYFSEIYSVDAQLYFITGADAICEILSWHKAVDLLNICSFIAATRPGYIFDESVHLPKEFYTRVHSLAVPALAISSSDIRHRVKQSKSIKYLLPELVEMYIEKNGLYQQFDKGNN